MPRENWLIVGISGATCSGKTTVAKELHSLFPNSVLLQQDEYFHDEKSEKHTRIPELDHINFEILSSIDMVAFKNQIKMILEENNPAVTSQIRTVEVETKFKEKFCASEISPAAYCIIAKFQKLQFIPNILIIEGFLIFNDDQLQDLCDLKFYFTMSKNVCWDRRKTRIYQPPDVPGYFEKYVWPSYLTHYDEVLRKAANLVFDPRVFPLVTLRIMWNSKYTKLLVTEFCQGLKETVKLRKISIGLFALPSLGDAALCQVFSQSIDSSHHAAFYFSITGLVWPVLLILWITLQDRSSAGIHWIHLGKEVPYYNQGVHLREKMQSATLIFIHL